MSAANDLSRREFLERLAAAYAMAMTGCRQKGDLFSQEHVCIHIYHPAEFVAAPLIEKTRAPSGRRADGQYFNIGLPEIIICTTRTKFLDIFHYFWPFSRDDLSTLQKSIEIHYSKATINGLRDVDDFSEYLRDHQSSLAQTWLSSALIFTFNEFTRHFTPEIIVASRQAGIHEFVLFKDPTLAPYLCTLPTLQKGFKRPPP